MTKIHFQSKKTYFRTNTNVYFPSTKKLEVHHYNIFSLENHISSLLSSCFSFLFLLSSCFSSLFFPPFFYLRFVQIVDALPGCSTLPRQVSHSTFLRFCNCGCATSPGCSTLPQQAFHFRLVDGYFVHFQSAQVYFQLLNSFLSKYQSTKV